MYHHDNVNLHATFIIMANFATDPTILPNLRETKGSILLRSNHMKYKRGVFISDWHAENQALPMDYDVSIEEDKDLRKSAYTRLGNADGSLKNVLTTTQDVLEEVGRLQPDYVTQEPHKAMVNYDNFTTSTEERETGWPKRGYRSVLPRHSPDHRKHRMVTTHSVQFQYPFEWTPKESFEPPDDPTRFNIKVSEIAETDGPKRRGTNTFTDYQGID